LDWGGCFGLEGLRGKRKLRITLGLRKVLTPRKNFPRETELEIFSEMGQNLGKFLQGIFFLIAVRRPVRVGVSEANEEVARQHIGWDKLIKTRRF